MIAPRWQKVFADLWSNKTRTLLVVLSIAVGVFAVGSIATAFGVTLTDMEQDFQSVNPHVARIYTDPFDDEVLNSVRRVTGVSEVDGRLTFATRLLGRDGKWHQIELQTVPTLDKIRVDRLRGRAPGVAAPPPLNTGDLYMERASVALAGAAVGDTIKVEIANGRQRTLRLAGIVHDGSGVTPMFSGLLNGYVNPDTMEWLGQGRLYNQMLVTVKENPRDEPHVTRVAHAVGDKVERSGRLVYVTLIFRPGEHPAMNPMKGMLMILTVLGVLIVGLSAFLVTNTMNSLLSQHLRQIGVMKAIGASAGQIMMMYAVLVTVYGVMALLFAIPLAALAGYAIAGFIAGWMNFNLAGFRVVPLALALEVFVALVVPLLAAFIPVRAGTRVTVREAISSYGLGKGRFGRSAIDRMLERIRFLSRPTLISLRNTFRRKTRLALTLSTLILAGAIFMSVFNLQKAFIVDIDEVLRYFLADVNIDLARPYRTTEIERLAMSTPGVRSVEAWSVITGQALSPDKESSSDVILWAPPANSQLVRPIMSSGRWLLPDDENAIVIGNQLTSKRPDLKAGDDLVIKIGTEEHSWHIVGIYRLPANVEPPFVYANYEYLSRLLNNTGRASSYRVVTDSSDAITEDRVAKDIERQIRASGIRLSNITTGATNRAQQTQVIDIFVTFLLVMAVQIALVGGLGLMGTMSMNVLERTREIGVLRAVGAARGAILRLVITEGMVIGLLSWVLAVLLSLPLTYLFNTLVGIAFVSLPLKFAFEPKGVLIWLGVIVALAGLASLWPAWSAGRLTVREVLAYE